MSDNNDTLTTIRFAKLRGQPYAFEIMPKKAQLDDLATELDLLDLRKVRFSGKLVPEDGTGWSLHAKLGATVVQPCRVTLAPVTTRIEEDVSRRYLTDLPEPPPGEVEMPDDDTVEALPDELDLRSVLMESLSLALPAFPRAEGVELGEAVFTEPGKSAMTDEDARPFAGLSTLKNKLENKED